MKLTAEQIKAVRSYAASHGRTWKSQLSHAWKTGRYEDSDDRMNLQQIRNNFGPSWLTRFSFRSGMTTCGCNDLRCPVHPGSECAKPATTTLWRVDMEDQSGTPFCEACAADAIESGLFADRVQKQISRIYEDDEV